MEMGYTARARRDVRGGTWTAVHGAGREEMGSFKEAAHDQILGYFSAATTIP